MGSGTTFREGNLRRFGRELMSVTCAVIPAGYRFPSQKGPFLKAVSERLQLAHLASLRGFSGPGLFETHLPGCQEPSRLQGQLPAGVGLPWPFLWIRSSRIWD